MASVVIAEDSPNLRLCLALHLQLGGHEVRAAGNGVGALALIAQQRPDLVILDLNMPDLDGLAAATCLREDPATADLLLVLTSGTHRGDLERTGCLAAFDAFLPKPYEMARLWELVNELTSSRCGLPH